MNVTFRDIYLPRAAFWLFDGHRWEYELPVWVLSFRSGLPTVL